MLREQILTISLPLFVLLIRDFKLLRVNRDSAYFP
jgi:hypothetical protein